MMLFHPRHSSPARTMFRLIVSVLGLIAAAIVSLVMSRPAGAQSAPRSVAYVITRGNDTLVVERLQRTTSRTLATVSLSGSRPSSSTTHSRPRTT